MLIFLGEPDLIRQCFNIFQLLLEYKLLYNVVIVSTVSKMNQLFVYIYPSSSDFLLI